MAPAVEIEVGQRWVANGAADEWIDLAGPIAGDSWAVITSRGEIATILTSTLFDRYVPLR